ncbi:MAG: tRNA lysidine(34) synthetase TilS [Janthinobacterium lividum]
MALPSLAINRTLLPPGDRVCVAVSGGADSTALLLALQEQAAALGIGVSAAHLHHGIRGDEADGDLAFLRDLCQRLDVALHTEHCDVPAAAAADQESLEEAARKARLLFFDRLLATGVATSVATAHTEDDQAETVMMKLIRGAWTEGLGGISPVLQRDQGRIIRPLLGTTRQQVIAFLQARGQQWREDSTNQSPAHTRNRVRAQLMPVLRQFNPSIGSTLATTAQLARDEEARWKPEIARLLTQLSLPGKPVRGGGRAVGTAPGEQMVAFELERLRGLDVATRRRLLHTVAERLGIQLGAADIQRVLLLTGLAPADAPADSTVPSKPNSRLDLRGGLRVERSLRELRFLKL